MVYSNHLRRVRRCFAGGIRFPGSLGHRRAYAVDDIAGEIVLILRQCQDPQARY